MFLLWSGLWWGQPLSLPHSFRIMRLLMETRLVLLKETTINAISTAESVSVLDEIKTRVLGKVGELTDILKGLKDLPVDQKPVIGQVANQVKVAIQEALDEKRLGLEAAEMSASLANDQIDISLPGKFVVPGKLHPLNQTMAHVVGVLQRLGFSVQEGPEIESHYYNFEALNIPPDHPAQDMHDTFYLQSGHVLRTHTSPVQIRTMEKTAPPLRVIAPGKVFRCDADVTHSPVFHQIEGLYVDKKVTFGNLKAILEFFLRELFGASQKVRFRPSYFPFTEPSAEVDVACFMCHGNGCGLCKQTGWIEILGAGMVNRAVFRHVGYDPDAVTGFAFGLGIERIAMLKYGVTDIRLFYENDVRFLRQF